MIDAVRLLARSEGVLLDPVYTGKAMAGLIDLLRRQEVLLLLLGRGVDVGGEIVGDRVLAVEEHGVRPQRGLPLDLAELLLRTHRRVAAVNQTHLAFEGLEQMGKAHALPVLFVGQVKVRARLHRLDPH